MLAVLCQVWLEPTTTPRDREGLQDRHRFGGGPIYNLIAKPLLIKKCERPGNVFGGCILAFECFVSSIS